VHAVRPLVVRASLAELQPAAQLRLDRVGEPLDLLAGQVGRQRVRRELRGVEDLVRPRAPDPGNRALVTEQGVETARVVAHDRAERLRVEREPVWAEVGKLLLGLLGRQEPDARALLRPGLGEDELGAVLEPEPERRALRARLADDQAT